MLSPEDKKWIQNEIRKQANVILTGINVIAESEYANVSDIYPGMLIQQKIPTVHPWGFVSAAPSTIFAVTARQGDYVGSRLVIGHRDRNRPSVNPGETRVYSAEPLTGVPLQQLILNATSIKIGSTSASEPLVLGDVLKSFMNDIIDILVAGDLVLTTSGGDPTAPNALVVAELEALRAKYLTSPLTNILSADKFTERVTLPIP